MGCTRTCELFQIFSHRFLLLLLLLLLFQFIHTVHGETLHWHPLTYSFFGDRDRRISSVAGLEQLDINLHRFQIHITVLLQCFVHQSVHLFIKK